MPNYLQLIMKAVYGELKELYHGRRYSLRWKANIPLGKVVCLVRCRSLKKRNHIRIQNHNVLWIICKWITVLQLKWRQLHTSLIFLHLKIKFPIFKQRISVGYMQFYTNSSIVWINLDQYDSLNLKQSPLSVLDVHLANFTSGLQCNSSKRLSLKILLICQFLTIQCNVLNINV